MDLFYEGGTSPLVERVETTPEGQGTIIHDIVHDAMGNILDDGVSRYFWDPRPIMRFHKQGGTSAYYRYSDYTAAGTMMARRGYTVDPVVYYAQMVTMESPSGQRLSDLLWNMDGDVFEGRDLVWLGDRLIATFEFAASDPDYVFTDHIGYPVMVMDPSANTTWSAVHEPYGEAVLTGGTAAGDPLLRYPGQWKDDPAFVVTDPPQRNLFANGYRWYNPDWGRYTQSDPIGVGGIRDKSKPSWQLDPTSEVTTSPLRGLMSAENLYSYTRGNPLLWADPLGLAVCFYSVSTHRLWCISDDGQHRFDIDQAWSGRGNCRDNLSCENRRDYGPIPRGQWDAGCIGCTPYHQVPRIPINPQPGTSTFGRTDFQFHQGGGPDSSWGCIVMPPNVYQNFLNFYRHDNDAYLEVTD